MSLCGAAQVLDLTPDLLTCSVYVIIITIAFEKGQSDVALFEPPRCRRRGMGMPQRDARRSTDPARSTRASSLPTMMNRWRRRHGRRRFSATLHGARWGDAGSSRMIGWCIGLVCGVCAGSQKKRSATERLSPSRKGPADLGFEYSVASETEPVMNS